MTNDQRRLPGMGPAAGGVARVRRAFDAQVAAQRGMGQIEPVDAGLIGLGRTLADSIDLEAVDPDGSKFTIGALAGKLFPVMLELRGSRRDSASDVGWDEELARLEAAIRDGARPGPTDDRGPHPGPPGPTA